jgi:hypothetical protein
MGVRIISENGKIISGPEFASSSRPKKSEYNKMIEVDSSDHSMGYSISFHHKNHGKA